MHTPAEYRARFQEFCVAEDGVGIEEIKRSHDFLFRAIMTTRSSYYYIYKKLPALHRAGEASDEQVAVLKWEADSSEDKSQQPLLVKYPLCLHNILC